MLEKSIKSMIGYFFAGIAHRPYFHKCNNQESFSDLSVHVSHKFPVMLPGVVTGIENYNLF